MAVITLKGNPVTTAGDLPGVGSRAPDFQLSGKDLTEVSLEDYLGKNVVLNIFPSLDTSVCAQSVRRFNEAASSFGNTVVLCVSMDLPFAQSRFCGAEGLEDVVTLSAFRNTSFGEDYGVRMVDGPLRGLLSRAVVILDESGQVTYTEQVPEITREPDYQRALDSLK